MATCIADVVVVAVVARLPLSIHRVLDATIISSFFFFASLSLSTEQRPRSIPNAIALNYILVRIHHAVIVAHLARALAQHGSPRCDDRNNDFY